MCKLHYVLLDFVSGLVSSNNTCPRFPSLVLTTQMFFNHLNFAYLTFQKYVSTKGKDRHRVTGRFSNTWCSRWICEYFGNLAYLIKNTGKTFWDLNFLLGEYDIYNFHFRLLKDSSKSLDQRRAALGPRRRQWVRVRRASQTVFNLSRITDRLSPHHLNYYFPLRVRVTEILLFWFSRGAFLFKTQRPMSF